MRSRTVCGWHPSSAAIVLVRAPSQLRAIILACQTQSAGACRLVGQLAHLALLGLIDAVGGHGAILAWNTSSPSIA